MPSKRKAILFTKPYTAEFVKASRSIPRCTCGGIVKPDVVLYEEQLNGEIIEKSIAAISSADLLIVAGTSLAVYPAAGLIRYFNGQRFVILNKSETPYDEYADLIIREPIEDVLHQAVE